MKESITVLLVEDDADYGYLVERWLSKCDDAAFNFLQAESINEAIETLATVVVHLLVCDLSLPNGKGLGGVSRLHALVPDIPIVILTGREENPDELESLLRHAAEVIYKQKLEGRFLGGQLVGVVLQQRLESALAENEKLKAQLAVYQKPKPVWFKRAARALPELAGKVLKAWLGPKDS